MHLTIHIGPHKTGTTAVQMACVAGARSLLKKGVLYPRVCWHNPAQHRLAFGAKKRKLPGSDVIPDFEVELHALSTALMSARVGRALISSEELFACPPEAISLLKQALAGVDVQVLTFLRRPDEFLVSSWNQKVRQPGNGFCAPIRRFVTDPLQFAPEIDYATCISNWADVFGEDAIRLEVYEDGPPLPRTLALLGCKPDLLPDPSGVNCSVPGAVAECMRHAKMAKLSADAQRRLSNRALAFFADSAPFHLSGSDRQAILTALEQANETIFRRFGRSNPYTPDAVPLASGEEPSNLTHSDLVRFIGALV